MEEIISFNSYSENYIKEESGKKRNTLRKVKDEEKFKLLETWTPKKRWAITITNKETQDFFVRDITDVTFWEGWVIISW